MTTMLFAGFFDFLKNVGRRHNWPSVDLSTIRKRARILVIDDSEFAYIPLLKKDGYTVTKWSDVRDLSQLEQGDFDLILLDIHGVAEDRSEEGGLGILRYLKDVAPAQIIIAYSAADFSLDYKSFFDRADATLDKGADYVEFKRIIDELLERRFSLEFYIDRVESIASSHDVDREMLRATAKKSILRRDEKILGDYLRGADLDDSRIDQALNVAQAGIGILQLLATL